MDESQEFHDVFEGVKVVWCLKTIVSNTNRVTFYPADDKRYYHLTFHRIYRDFVSKSYLNHVLEEGKNIGLIRCLLEETNVTPADIAENLMPKVANEDVEISLERLIQALRISKEEAEMKAKKENGTSGEEAEDAKEKEA
ncbi:hypothetical protein TSUD_03760 [Trifolium subterraneum]|nr:hypothetical protein TSUD_03760 [Trifolium subterraneum]